MLTGFIYNYFGFYFLVSIVECSIVLILLSWLIFLISKMIFGRFFASIWWENLFVIMIGFPTLIELYVGSIFFLSYLKVGDGGLQDLYFPYTVFSITFDLFYPLLIFFVAYLIHFIVRFVRYEKEKTDISAQK